jgi:hypothetical protein
MKRYAKEKKRTQGVRKIYNHSFEREGVDKGKIKQKKSGSRRTLRRIRLELVKVTCRKTKDVPIECNTLSKKPRSPS